ncbi:MAG: response regulator [Bacteroidales bacterium]|nr:response regulator [Bacteroidales bacterium]
MKCNRIIVLAALALLAVSCREQAPAAQENPVAVVLSDRLSNSRINAITQDRQGHIWFATFRGLDKFDGQTYHQYFCTDDASGLPDNQISAILAASDGSLWVSTVGGVAVLSPNGGWNRVESPAGFLNITHIMEARDGRILFSNGNSLFVYDAAQNALRPVVRELGAFAGQVLLLKDGRLLAVCDMGWTLRCYDTQDFSVTQSVTLPHQSYHICDAGHDELWFSGMGGLSILDARSFAAKPVPAVIMGERRITGGDVDIIFAAGENSILLNVIGKGFFNYNPMRESLSFQDDADFPYQVPSTEVRTIFRDNGGNLWFGTTDQGWTVSHATGSQFSSNKFLTSAFAGKTVVSLDTDKSGNLWITTRRDGLWRYGISDGKLENVPVGYLIQDSEVGYIRISKLFCDSAGEYWLLFTDKMRAMRCKWDGKRFRPLDTVYAFNPMCIAEDDRGCIWLGGFSPSLVRYDKADRSTQNVPLVGQDEWTYVSDLLLREPGRLMAACFGRFPVEVNTYSLEASPASVSAEEQAACIKRSMVITSSLFKDGAGNIWMGTVGNGVLCRKADSGLYGPVEGAPCPDICSMQEDRHGNIWVSSMNGLGKYDRTVGEFIHYFEADGIGGNQFSDRASCILPDGTLLFGGTHGITCFNPLDAPARRTVPLVFEDLRIHNQLVRPSEDGPIQAELCEKPDVTIRHSQNGFSISFAALDYSGLEQIRYAYRLDGFDKYWIRLGTGHEAYYANLPPGKYKFRVRIADGSHSITETEESLNIKVLPPWYGSWWAILLFSLLFLAALYILFRLFQHVRRVRKRAAAHIRAERREREQAEAAREAEKALNRIQMNYFSNVAHEFRTPLTMIAGPVSQLAASEGVKGQDRQLVSIIQRNAAWMLSLVGQLLDFNRIGNSKLQMKVAKMDVLEPLRDIADLFRFNAESKGIEFTTYGLEDSFVMWVDADKMQKIVMNLLSNAMKFTPSGGKVSLGFDVVPRSSAAAQFPLTEADTDGQYAQISVADSGPGIPESEMEKIFERFYQMGGHKGQGSGIGLYYARALTGLHHGYIKAWNRPEGGAMFSFVLPVSASSYTEDERTSETPQLQIHDAAVAMPASTEESDAEKKHIAVVDDDIDIANYLKVMLSPLYKVSVYFDATSALAGMEENVPDLVISDVVMPGKSGYELCEAVKADLQLSHIPVVLVTAKVAVENQVAGLDKGADAYVTKPFQPAYLLALVKSLLENREKLHRQLGSVTTTEEIAPEALSPRDAAFMNELYALMEKELANADLDIIRISEMMKISRTKFYYKVKGLTGENPSVFFRRYKLNRAADLLREGKFNMSEIAYMTGFNTLSHFSTSFKKQFGVPPSEFRG